MKKVISGVLCDTDTAKMLGEYEHGCKSSLHWYVERLYRTKSVKYFIHGEGHAASPYAKKVAQSEWAPGEAIKLLPPGAARQWAEDHLDPGEYIAGFGEPEEDGEPVVLTIDSTTKRRLDRMKEVTGKSIKQLVAEAVIRYSGEE